MPVTRLTSRNRPTTDGPITAQQDATVRIETQSVAIDNDESDSFMETVDTVNDIRRYNRNVGIYLLMVSLCCFIIGGLDFTRAPNSTMGNEHAQNKMDTCFTCVAMAGIIMFFFSLSWFC